MFNMSRTVGQCVLGIADSHHQICDGPAHGVLHTHTASSMRATPDYDSTLSSAINAKQTGASGTLERVVCTYLQELGVMCRQSKAW